MMNKMNKTVFFSALALTASLSVSNLAAATRDWTQSGGGRQCRMNIPDSINGETIRGILIFGNGAGGNSLSEATNSELVAWAESMKFAVIGTSGWGWFDSQSEIDQWNTMLQFFAGPTQFNHPELVNAPWLPVGHSNGGQMSYGFNSFRPDKTIGFIITKGQYYRTEAPAPAALKTPGMLTAGTADLVDDQGGTVDPKIRQIRIERLFTINRPRGALWAWINEQGVDHSDTLTRNMTYPFMEECVRLRYPADQQPSATYQPRLKDLHEGDGWLVGDDTADWNTGYTTIKAAQDETGNIRSLGWVPNKRMAYIYRAFSSYNKVGSINSGGTSGSSSATATVMTAPQTLNYRVNLTNGSWNSIEFFEGDESLGVVTPGGPDGNSPKASKSVQYGGYYVFYGVVTKTDNTKACTPLRRIFIKGPARPTQYQTWATGNLPSGSQNPADDPYGIGISNIVRYGLGLGTGANVDRTRLPKFTGFVTQGVIEYAEYTYKLDAAARDAGVNVMPVFSSDMITWTRSLPGEGSFYQYSRNEDTVTIRIPVAQTSTSSKILIDFGVPTLQTTQDPANIWNNMLSYTVDSTLTLMSVNGGISGVTLGITSEFTNTNNEGTQSPGVYVANATRDSFYYDGGRKPKMVLSGFDPSKTYTFKLFGSKVTGTAVIRSTKYTVNGTNTSIVAHDATGATNNPVQTAAVTPSSQGIITIDMEKSNIAPVNTSTSGVGYLGTMEINGSGPFTPNLPGGRLFLKLVVDDRTY